MSDPVITDEEKDALLDGVENGDVEVLNVDLPNDSENITVGAAQHDCRHDPLDAIELSLLTGP